MKYTIEEVLNEKQAKEFLLLPVSLYKNDENWVRPLDNDIRKYLTRKRILFLNMASVPAGCCGMKKVAVLGGWLLL